MPRIERGCPVTPPLHFEPVARSRNYNFHAFDCGSASAVLPRDSNRVTAASQGLRKIFKRPVGMYVGHGLTIDDESRARFRASADLHNITTQLSAADFQNHVLSLALCRERKLE